ncbi:MAG: hypothetical protein Q8L66_03725 [Caulobacter sp.]|nr:hypothetical protein [Caulobacter sp.]
MSTVESRIKAEARNAALERLRGPGFGASLAGASGRMLHVDGVIRPLLALNEGVMRGGAASFGLKEQQPDGSRTPMQTKGLNTVDLERIDLAVVDRAFAAFPVAAAGDRPPLLILPLSWSSLRNSRTRRRLLRLAAAGQLQARNIAFCEVTDIEPGTPQSVLREVTGQLQPIFRGVLARVTTDRKAIKALTDCGFVGAAVEANDLGRDEDEGAMLRAVLALQKIGPTVLAHAVRSVTGLTAVRAAGARWASLEIVPGALGSRSLAAHAKAAAGETPAAAL